MSSRTGSNQLRAILLSSLVLGSMVIGSASGPGSAVDYSREIQPLLAQKCLRCHGPDKQRGGLRLDDREVAVDELDSGERAIVPGDPDASVLMERVTHEDPGERMPLKEEPLSREEIELLRAWIASGAGYERHWAYRPLDPGPLPDVEDEAWCLNEVDRYVLARLEDAGVEPCPQADRYTLIRRLHLDLLGLLPSIEEVDAFVDDGSPEAYERLVDRLLSSPHFGERWGRHWLDKARYADSDGYEKDNVRPEAWRYRDWVIDAINRDVPFDRFTIEQIAGDLLPGSDPATSLATAFQRQTLTNTEGGVDKEEFRVAAVMDRTETLGTVWLGLTVGCARCHSHKFDSITQDEYYGLYAFFDNADEKSMELPASFTPDSKEVKVRVIAERLQKPRTTHLLHRGDFLRPRHEVEPSVPAVLHPLDCRAGNSRADRLDLARWLVDPRNPLTPRVVANHVWAHLFGEGIVRSPGDFGVRGESPTHPRLLDWLGRAFLDSGWSRKRLIRKIVLSRTYRQASRHRPGLVDRDPLNTLLHRQNRFRLEAEILRDIALAASGLLVRKVGGPSVFPPIPEGVTDLTYNSSFQWKVSEGDDRYRRGLYTFFKRTAPHPNLTTFDCPDSNKTNVERGRSNTPIGALVLLNNEVFAEAAQALARRILTEESPGDDGRIRFLCLVCLSRKPETGEVERLATLLEQARGWYVDHPQQAATLVGAHAAEGVEGTEQAAWVAVSRIVLNLDEFLARE